MYRRATVATEEAKMTLPSLQKNPLSGTQTVFQTILSSTLPDEEKRVKRMAQEGFIIIVAGSDTISRILTAATFHLLANQGMLERLERELREAMPDPTQNVEIRKLEGLPWLVCGFNFWAKNAY